ncbi:MAG TPA: NTP transferase domain-containing protein [Acidimicrobiales bacterium]|nr:NTP transferase domain-containing protein [Acidimicrobiales bacterium]
MTTPPAGGSGMAAVVLAAGAGRRFAAGIPKLRATVGGRPLVWWAATRALDSGVGPVWVVTGAAAVDDVLPPGVRTIHNAGWEQGQAGSLAVAVAEARRHRLHAVVVGLGDQPGIPADAWRAVAACDAPVAVATYGGRRRHPVKLGEAVWDLLPGDGDEGARPLIRARPELVAEVACEGNPDDIDTLEDLERWS